MKIGIIGTGNMGRILIEALIDGNAISPSELIITNRNQNKVLEIKELIPNINIASSATEVAKYSNLIFLCVKPSDMFTVIQRIAPILTEKQCVVSITSPISVEQIEAILPCSIIRAIPSITNRALAGVSLLTFGTKCEPKWREYVTMLFTTISIPIEIENEITRVASDIVSCGPAFFVYLTRRFIHAAVEETNISEEVATKLATEMLIGLGQLLQKEFYTLPTLQEKVCVPGGITGEGIKVLDNQLGNTFEQLFQATHSKFQEDLAEIKKQFI